MSDKGLKAIFAMARDEIYDTNVQLEDVHLINRFESEITALVNEPPNPKPDWVSVEDRLPMEADEGDSAYKCIVAYRSGNFSGTSVSWFEFSDEFNVGGFSGDITHWMELPEPPKTRSEE